MATTRTTATTAPPRSSGPATSTANPALLALLLAGCSPEKDPAETDWGELSDCDPVAPTQCGLPFPSTFYMRQDDASPTGWRVHLGPTTLPVNANDYQPAPDRWNERDGFSPLGALIAHFPGVSLEGTISHTDLDAYLEEGAKTVILDAETGERVPHFVELDMSQDEDDRRAFLMYPVEPLQYGRRYVVGIRGLVDESGAAVAPSDAFKSLRDGKATEDGDVELRRDYYDESVFPVLEAAGIDRGELVLAWDFVTASQEGITGKAVWMRDDALDRVGPDGPAYTITSVEYDVDEHTARRIKGEMTVPLYLEVAEPGSLLTRDEGGMPYYNGDTTIPFTVIVPRSLVDEGRQGAILQYGHGLLGSQGEVESGYLAELADTYGYVLIATDWTGMMEDDFDSIVLMIVQEIDKFAMIPERSQQGFAEFAVAMRLISGSLAQDPALMTTDPETGEAVSVVDTTQRYYYGNSQGGILGGAYLALSTDIERGSLGVGGTPYNLLLLRSVDFTGYFLMLQTMWPDPIQVALWLGYMQTLWDSGESSGYALAMNQQPLPGTSPKQVLQQVAIGDAQVTTLGAHIQARSYGGVLIDPPVRDVWGLETKESGYVGSALVEWDYGLEEPVENLPPEKDTDPHGRPRKDPAGMEQLDIFLRTGEIVNTCGGPCQELE